MGSGIDGTRKRNVKGKRNVGSKINELKQMTGKRNKVRNKTDC